MAVVGSLGPLQERQVRRLWIGQALSNLGSAVVPIALAFAVLDLTGSATDLGLVLVASRSPEVLLVLAGGVVGDRLPRRRSCWPPTCCAARPRRPPRSCR